jgi:putative DNA methylase
MLSSKKGKEAWIEPIVNRESKKIEFRAHNSGTKDQIAEAKKGTKGGRGANFLCLLSGSAITPEYVKRMSSSGKMGQMLIGIAAKAKNGRVFLTPTEADEKIALTVEKPVMPTVKLPNHSQYVGVLGYGFEEFSELFSARQTLALKTFSGLVGEAKKLIVDDLNLRAAIQPELWTADKIDEYAKAVSLYLGFCVSKSADYWSNLCTWRSDPKNLGIGHVFSRQAIPMVWDFAEGNPFSDSSGNFLVSLDWIVRVIRALPAERFGKIIQADAQSVKYPPGTAISTDPPYYDNIPYADISDFFYIWLRIALRDLYPTEFSTLAVPKMEELVADRMRLQRSYYAFKQSEIDERRISSSGWATFFRQILELVIQWLEHGPCEPKWRIEHGCIWHQRARQLGRPRLP